MTSTIQNKLATILGISQEEVLQLDDNDLKPLTTRQVEGFRSNTPRARRARQELRAELVAQRTHEINHYTDLELIMKELTKSSKAHGSIKLSISVSKAKARAFSLILNGKEAEAQVSLDRMKEKFGLMLEAICDSKETTLNIVDVEHQDQITSRDYLGDKETENARRLGKNIMENIYLMENHMKVLC